MINLFSIQTHFEMTSATSCNLDMSYILSSPTGLNESQNDGCLRGKLTI